MAMNAPMPACPECGGLYEHDLDCPAEDDWITHERVRGGDRKDIVAGLLVALSMVLLIAGISVLLVLALT